MKSLMRTLYCTLLLIFLWAAAVACFALYINNYTLADDVKADGIIVLTGGGGRIEYGLDLLGHDRGQALFISGVNRKVPLGDLISKAPESMRDVLSVMSLGKITLGHDATNTIGNAEESAAWVKKRGYKTILLVTADYHMPRSLLEFHASLPADTILIPAAVKTRDYSTFSWVAEPEVRNLILSEFHKLLAAKLRRVFISSSAA